ncbi:hypothetical protein NQ315_014550 [Exocentrus adspersus]|uniref:TIMELESS-interacting protein n=1 Tax=Exocentrus adspersus TaxID=1586481 RepID=A0AAV8VKU6_9CUCU|nr:hypothetical protein NQ315_014550 [Exocentrus adspersus]
MEHTEIKKIRMGLNFDFENELMSNEIEQESDGFVDTPNEQFDQLVSTNESEPAISQEQLERIRQNMERAKRLREEKLNSARKTTQNNISNQNSENLGITVDGSSASATNEATNNVSEEYHQINGNEFNFTTLVEDNEDDIEDIINDINTEESNESIRHDNQTNDTILHLHENT